MPQWSKFTIKCFPSLICWSIILIIQNILICPKISFNVPVYYYKADWQKYVKADCFLTDLAQSSTQALQSEGDVCIVIVVACAPTHMIAASDFTCDIRTRKYVHQICNIYILFGGHIQFLVITCEVGIGLVLF